MAIIISVLPGKLRLPPSRQAGPDLTKLAAQLAMFGASTVGMPPLQVTRGAGGEFMINDGVTRASRIHRYAPHGTTIQIEIIDDRPTWQLSKLTRVEEA